MDVKNSGDFGAFNGSVIPHGEEVPADNRSFLDFDESPPSSPSKFKGLFGSFRHRARSNPERSDTAVGRLRSKTNPFDDNKLRAFLDTITVPPKSKNYSPKPDTTKGQPPVPKITNRRTLRMGLKPLTMISVETAPIRPNSPILPYIERVNDETWRNKTNSTASLSPRGATFNRISSPKSRSPLSKSHKENVPSTKESATHSAHMSNSSTPLRANHISPTCLMNDAEGDHSRRKGIRLPHNPSHHDRLVNGTTDFGSDLSDLHVFCAAVLQDGESPKFDKSIKPPQTPRLPSLWARDSLQLEKSRILLEGTTPPSFTSRYSTDSNSDVPPMGDLSTWWKEEGNYYQEEDGDNSNLLEGLRE